jgi:hypothetical protein
MGCVYVLGAANFPDAAGEYATGQIPVLHLDTAKSRDRTIPLATRSSPPDGADAASLDAEHAGRDSWVKGSGTLRVCKAYDDNPPRETPPREST